MLSSPERPVKFTVSFLILLVFFPIDILVAQNRESTRPKVGLVLSGGGARGFAHIGALKVMQEAGLEFDFVGGTSMGSIIGALYAIGYHPDSIENMVKAQNWNALLNDRIPRRFIPIEEKTHGERLIITFPIRDRRVLIRQGISNGMRIDMLLNRLTTPVYRKTNFSEFPLPFVCIATDLSDGSNVVLKDGILSHAIRASMSIPTYFTPVEMKGRKLVDGGVINNFPVREVKDLGADIIIGVDVQSGLHPLDDLNSMVRILDQVVSFYRMEANAEAVKMTDIYIKPDLSSFDIMSFTDYDSIIERGEKAARQMLPQLKQLADSLDQSAPHPGREMHTMPLDSIFVTVIEYRGLQNVPRSYLRGVLDIKPRTYIQLDELENNIMRAYGSNFFEHIRYYFLPDTDGAYLVIDAVEAGIGQLGAGVNYNSDYKVSLLLNASFKNVIFKGSKVFVDLNLGENPRLSGTYMIDRGRQPGFGLNVSGLRLDFSEYEKNRTVESYRATHYTANAYLLFSFDNTLQFKAGTQYEYSRIRTAFNPDDFDSFSSYLNFFVDWSIDSYNKATYPTNGMRMHVKVKYVTTISDNWARDIFSNAFIASLKYEQRLPTGPRSAFQTGLQAGFTLNDQLAPPQHWFILGGQTRTQYFDGFFPFTGLRFIENTGKYAIAGNVSWQYQIYPRFYITPKADLGFITDTFDDMFDRPRLLLGYGVAIGYDSFLGPIELSLMGANVNAGLQSFINIGYSF